MRFTVLIPARLASTRLPNKPLADIGGAPMIVRVAQRVLSGNTSGNTSGTSSGSAFRAVVAADSPEIIAACQAHGIEAVLTRTDHPSGSDRLAEACNILGLSDDEIVVNVQGDEPLIDPALVSDVASLLQRNPLMSMSTAAHPIETLGDFSNPNIVKVVLDANNVALYFSRAPIAFARDFSGQAWWQDVDRTHPEMAGAAPLRHVGIYGYRAGFLRLFPTLSRAPIEVVEALEQLRAMWHGHRIAVHVTHRTPGPGVDTPEDLERVRQLFKV
jgi:3-deoxy-manno-octulosonate cytidylyltransferase (CMP-KDO synthetase)